MSASTTRQVAGGSRKGKPPRTSDGRMALIDHLREFRNRLGISLLALAVCVVVALVRGSQRASVGAALAVAAGVFAVFWTIRVGHTGAGAVWSDIVARTNKQ